MKKSAGSGTAEGKTGSAEKGALGIEDELIDLGGPGGKPPHADTEAVGDIVEQAKEVQRVAEKIYFLSILKRFGLAFGGILILLGTISAVAFFLLFFGIFTTGFPKNIELLLEIGLSLLAIIHILAGLTLLAN